MRSGPQFSKPNPVHDYAAGMEVTLAISVNWKLICGSGRGAFACDLEELIGIICRLAGCERKEIPPLAADYPRLTT
jgi:hypothetical protein